MRGKTVFLCPLVFLFLWSWMIWPHQARGDYNSLKQAYDNYTPPSYGLSDESPPQGPQETRLHPEMEAEKKRIQEAVARWEQSIAHGDGPPAFFRPDPSLLGQLEKIRGDEKAIAQALTQNFSLETVEVLVLLRNPDIRAAEDRMRAAIQGLRQVTALDEILMRYSAFTEGVMAGVGPMKGKEPVEMRFPFPGVLALKGQIAQQEVRIARDALEAARRDAMTEARKDFWRLMYNREALQITRETLDLFEHLEQVATARYETGKTSFQDVVKIRIERGILADRVTSFQEQTKNLEIRICAALNLPPSTRLGAPLGKHPSKKIPRPERLYDIALERNQELLQLRDRIGKMERMIEMAETMILPPFSMNLSLYEDEAVNQVGTQATKETFPVSIKASRGLGLPKRPFYGVEDAYLLQTRQEINALKEQLDARKQETITMVRNAWYGLDKAIRGEALYRDHILGSAKAALDVSSRGYESGKVVFADVISSYTLWLRSNLEKERWGAEIGIAWAELEKALGTTID